MLGAPLAALYLVALAGSSVAATGTFPQDVFARPAFEPQIGLRHDAHNLPIRYHTAITIMRQQSTGSGSIDARRAASSLPTATADLAVADLGDDRNPHAPPLSWFLHRSGAATAHLCAIPDFTAAQTPTPSSAVDAIDNSTSSLPRQALVVRALHLIEPLKQICLFHTIDWFTYSFCHGKYVRQFRALTPASAADRANKRAGGGANGKKAAIKAAAEVAKLRAPVADTAYDAFTLGRWRPDNDRIVDSDEPRASKAPGTATSQQPASKTSKTSLSTAIGIPSGTGTELIEVVQFGDWDEEELHAQESQIQSRLSSSSTGTTSARPSSAAHLNRQRYISQTWSDGTLCDINNQPRSIEVQFHCGNRKGLGDQIVALKETTICNYVVIIETSRLCSEPAFAGAKDDVVHQVKCHKVVRDDWPGLALGDSPATSVQADRDGGVAGKPARAGASLASDRVGDGEEVAANDAQAAQERRSDTAAHEVRPHHGMNRGSGAVDGSGSHTYGDLSRFSSVHDDFYDEALGGDGYLDEQDDEDALYEPEAAYRDRYDVGAGDDEFFEEKGEMYFKIGLDEDGKVSVDVLSEEEAAEERALDLTEAEQKAGMGADSDASASADGKGGSRRSRRTRREADVQIDLTDLLDDSDLLDTAGDADEEAHRALAKTIEQKLGQARERSQRTQHGDGEVAASEARTADDARRGSMEESQAFVDLYQELLEAMRDDPLNRPDTAEGGHNEAEADAEGPKAAQPNPVQEATRRAATDQATAAATDDSTLHPANFPRNGRMAKVGDSLVERAKRSYEAKDRNREKAKKDSHRPHLDAVRVEL